jgi:CTP-dependent riboflavin kinase
MRNSSNNNNNNNVDLNIINQIKNKQKQIDDLTNDVEELENEQIVSKKIYHTNIIKDRNKYIKLLKTLYSSYDKYTLEELEERK